MGGLTACAYPVVPKPMKKLRLILCATALAVCGCASIAGRGNDRFYPGVYPGARNDISAIESQGVGTDMPCLWMLSIFDFPLSAALDTALLPWDLPYWAFQPSASTNNASK